MDWITAHQLNNRAPISTILWRDQAFIKKLTQQEVKLLPKRLIDHIELRILPKQADYLLVDDEEVIRRLWEMQFEQHGLKLITFSSAQELLTAAGFYQQAKVYIDVNLGQDSGIELARKLNELGYKELYLATGMQEA